MLQQVLTFCAGLWLTGLGLYDLPCLFFTGRIYAIGKGGPSRWLYWHDEKLAILFIMAFYLGGGFACLWSLVRSDRD